jgi:hypothetical protein
MSTHFNALTEAFDKPYKYSLKKKQSNFWIGKFDLPDGGDITVYFEGMEWSDVEMSWGVKFQRTNPKRKNASMDITGEGDAMRVFATVIEIIKEFLKKEKPQELNFAAHKPEWMTDLPHDHPDKKGQKGSREKLYKKLVQRYAGRMGYKYSSTSSSSATEFSLVRK